MPKEQYMCQLCSNHGHYNQPKKGHKQLCPNRNCTCQLCSLNVKRRVLDQIERQWRLKKEKKRPATKNDKGRHNGIDEGEKEEEKVICRAPSSEECAKDEQIFDAMKSATIQKENNKIKLVGIERIGGAQKRRRRHAFHSIEELLLAGNN